MMSSEELSELSRHAEQRLAKLSDHAREMFSQLLALEAIHWDLTQRGPTVDEQLTEREVLPLLRANVLTSDDGRTVDLRARIRDEVSEFITDHLTAREQPSARERVAGILAVSRALVDEPTAINAHLSALVPLWLDAASARAAVMNDLAAAARWDEIWRPRTTEPSMLTPRINVLFRVRQGANLERATAAIERVIAALDQLDQRLGGSGLELDSFEETKAPMMLEVLV